MKLKFKNFRTPDPVLWHHGVCFMGGGGSAPAAPDPTATANAQTASNRDTAAFNAALNRTNTTTPYGNQTWTQNGTDPTTGAPLWSSNISVAPGAQTAIDNTIGAQSALSGLQQGQVGQVANAIGQQIDPNQLPGITGSIGGGPQVGNGLQGNVSTNGMPGYAQQVGSGDIDGARLQAQQANYRKHTSMLDPQYAQEKEALDSQLANQGITQGSKAYNDATENFARKRDFAYGNARDSAISGGNAEALQQFGMGATNAGLQNNARTGMFGEALTNAGLNNSTAQTGFGNLLTSGNFGNQANQQALAQLLQLRNQPLNELSALRSGSQVQTPQFQSTPAVMSNATDVAGITQNGYNNALNGYNASQSSSNGAMSGIFGLGSSLLSSPGSMAMLGLSDIRAKKNIEPIGKTFGGENLYKYQYKGSDVPQIGVMAQEIMEHKPEAVVKHPSGMFMVDYSQVT